MAEILDSIQRELEARAEVSDWTLQETRWDSTQLFLIGREPEALRRVHTVSYDLVIYRDHDGGRGEAAISLEPGQIAELPARLDEAVFLAGMSRNPPFSLPRSVSRYPDVQAWDTEIGTAERASQTARALADEARAALAGEDQVRLSSMELFLESADVALRTSTGIAAQRQSTHAECELVVTSRNDAGEESEAQDLWERRRATDLDVAGRARRQAQYARDSLRAQLPDGGDFAVVLPAETMLPFFDAVTYRSSAGARYRQATPWEAGRPIVADQAPGTFDRLDIASDATLPYGLDTRAFDEQGLPGRRFALIEDGVLQCYWATQRYADYMGIPATGAVANIEMAPGAQPASALLAAAGAAPIFHIVTFSWLNPDEITGDFVGEIRLGYQITPAGTVPIKGGTISGNVFTALMQGEFSRETAFVGSYQGPAVARFHGLTVAG